MGYIHGASIAHTVSEHIAAYVSKATGAKSDVYIDNIIFVGSLEQTREAALPNILRSRRSHHRLERNGHEMHI